MENFDDTNQTNDNSTNDNGSSEFTIPEEYANRGWARTFADKSGDDLKNEIFKCLDNSQNLISKRVGEYLKDTDLSTLENYEDIKKSLATQFSPKAPENIQDYNLNEILKNDKGEQEFEYSEDVVNNFSTEFQKLGLTKEQGQGLIKYFTNFEVENFQKFANPEELNKSLKEMFPKDEDKTKCESLINEFISEDDAKFLKNSAPNKTILMFYKIAKGLTDKYDYKEHSAPSGNGSNLVRTKEEKNAEHNKIFNKLKELETRPHTTQEKDELLKQLVDINK